MLIVRQLPFGFAESQASGLQCRRLGLFVTLQLAQIGAGEGNFGLQFALALIVLLAVMLRRGFEGQVSTSLSAYHGIYL